MDLAAKHRDRLPQLKRYVERWHEYFKRNNQRFWDYTKFVCATTLSNAQRTALQSLNKPPLEFNVIEAMVARLRGEFAKHTPSFEVRAADGVPIQLLTPEFTRTIDVIEGHMRAIFSDSTNDSLKYKFYTDLLVGGFSVGEVFTKYVNPRSFEQVIKVERVFDPTLTFFDPLARQSHKGDGQYCGKLVPMSVEDFKLEFGAEAAKDIEFSNGARLEGFNWAYQNQQQDIVLVASMFIKKQKRTKIVKLSNGHVVPEKHYKLLLEAWEQEGVIEVPPTVLDERWTDDEVICRYRFCGERVLSYEETDFKMLPLIFMDGNSVLIRGIDTFNGVDTGTESGGSGDGGEVQQMTKPYIMHAKDMQLLMNYAGQSLASEMENIVQHQYIAAIESIPDDEQYEGAYTNPQLANVLVYNQLYDKDPSIQLNPPQILERRQIPPILESTFNGAINHIQTILGSYEASLGINDNQLSGVAIQQGALQSNAAAIPYLVGFTNGMSRFAEVILDLIPKYYRTPRTLPIIKPDGKHDYQIINQPNVPDNVMMDYDPNNLQIKVEMGVSAAVQKQVAIDQIIRLTAASPDFAAFINEFGLEVILDNMDIRGIDHLKELSVKYMEAKQQQREAQSQQPNE
ncbi:MAG: hypothetical protein KIH63_004560, partial [Candidatus Saccharibacteria bacterium]|nr:hypothetical protein [Candidatus Saccharibacteria bacterium]